MKKYTEKDLEKFERDGYGRIFCPSGDYTKIKTFPEKCSFGNGCSFGVGSSFGKLSSFGNGCSFGKWSKFSDECTFEDECYFGVRCNFGQECDFGDESSFGDESNFGEKCSFGAWRRFGVYCRFSENSNFGKQCSFGEWCDFGHNCSHEGLTNSIYMAIDKIGSELRKTYFFKAKEGYFVRAGCFFGTLDEFKAQVHETHGGTIHETTYLMACDLAVKLLDSQWKE